MFLARNRRRPTPRRSPGGRDTRLGLEQLDGRALLSVSLPGTAAVGSMPSGSDATAGIRVIDIIPGSQSGETGQNSEPSIAVNPNDTSQAVIGVFSFANSSFSPYYSTSDGGTTWTQFDTQKSHDSTLSWSASGTLYLGRTSKLPENNHGFIKATLEVDESNDPVTTGTGFSPIPGSVYKSAVGAQVPDQPRVVAAQVGGTDHIYLGYNNFTGLNNQVPPTGNTATVEFSVDGGRSWTTTVVDQGNQGGFADGPPVQPAVNGHHVYVAFERGTQPPDVADGVAFGQVVVVRDDQAGGDGFKDLGPGGEGTIVATGFAPIATPNGAESLGNERLGSDLTLAVDPRDAGHLYVGYAGVPTVNGVIQYGTIQVQVQESTDGGADWHQVFATSGTAGSKAALPYLAVADNGTVGLLYTSLTLNNNASYLETHFVQTGDDFATFTDTMLSKFKDGVPPLEGQPYIGDYEGLKAVGNTFYGTFSASNQADGTNAVFPGGVSFQRDFTGSPGTGSFQLTDGRGKPVPTSIDPFFFAVPTGGDSRSAAIEANPTSGSPQATAVGILPTDAVDTLIGNAVDLSGHKKKR